jgi:hypothetical protein
MLFARLSPVILRSFGLHWYSRNAGTTGLWTCRLTLHPILGVAHQVDFRTRAPLAHIAQQKFCNVTEASPARLAARVCCFSSIRHFRPPSMLPFGSWCHQAARRSDLPYRALPHARALLSSDPLTTRLYCKRRTLFGCAVILISGTLIAAACISSVRGEQPDKLGTIPDAGRSCRSAPSVWRCG